MDFAALGDQILINLEGMMRFDHLAVVVAGAAAIIPLWQNALQHRRDARRTARERAIDWAKWDRPELEGYRTTVKEAFDDDCTRAKDKDGKPVPLPLAVILGKLGRRASPLSTADAADLHPNDTPNVSEGQATDVIDLVPQGRVPGIHGKKLESALDAVIDYRESLGKLVFSRTVDEDMAFETTGKPQLDFIFTYWEYIRNERKGRPRLWEYLAPLAVRWHARLLELSRKMCAAHPHDTGWKSMRAELEREAWTHMLKEMRAQHTPHFVAEDRREERWGAARFGLLAVLWTVVALSVLATFSRPGAWGGP